MAIQINETVQFTALNIKDIVREFNESTTKEKKRNGLVIEIAAIQVGTTRNMNYYSEAELEAGVVSWTAPFQKPIIINHDLTTDPLGRVIGATVESNEGVPAFIKLQAAITDPVAIERVLDKRYLTGSIGAMAENVICSICGVDWGAEQTRPGLPCKHKFGTEYDGQKAYKILKNLTFYEYSFVNAPSDQNSKILDVKQANENVAVDIFEFEPKVYQIGLDSHEIQEFNNETLDKRIVEAEESTFLRLKSAFLSAGQLNSGKNYDFLSQPTTNSTELVNIGESNMPKETDDVEASELLGEQEEDILDVINASEEEDVVGDDEVSVEEDSETEESEEEQSEETEDSQSGEDTSETTVESEENSEAESDDTEPSEESEEEAPEVEEDETVAEEDTEESETTEEVEAEDETDEVESESESQELADETSDEPDVAAMEAEIQRLTSRSNQLAAALHRSLVERIVDAKIYRGLVEVEKRAEAVESHSDRKASSLIDTLKDLSAIPLKQDIEVLRESFEPTVGAVSEANTELVNEDSEEVEPTLSVDEKLESKFVDLLMGRTVLH